ncbi:MAG TPA: M15 family metallopeptidase [Steroidobacteraceae bacterium]|jgi:LAS superfamily LD-carboxypeptidase LdcB|nr:M15 family metallopeptidase [Steroidobacteraceae bacterium]
MTGSAATIESRTLTPAQLTGRTRSHVIDVPHPRLTMHQEAANAFLALRAAAATAGIELSPASSFRDFDQQVAIWNDKFAGRRPLLDKNGRPLDRGALSDEAAVAAILIWSALPGASRHHWGTEVDVIDVAGLTAGQQARLVPEEFAPGGPFERLHDWLEIHAAHYGFYRPYDIDRGGVQPEPWHLSYAPIAQPALPTLTVEVLRQCLAGVELGGADVVSAGLRSIHARYVASVAAAAPAVLAANGILSPAARPS